MSRTLSAGQLTDLAAKHRREGFRLWIADETDTLIEYTDRVESLTFSRNADSPGATWSATLVRETQGGGTLAPGMTSPQKIAASRRCRIDVAVNSAGEALSDFEVMLEGEVDAASWGGRRSNRISVKGRDLWKHLADTFIETPTTYGSVGGTALASVIQSVLNDWYPGTAPTLLVEGTNTTVIYEFEARRQSIGALIGELLIDGWSVRWKWHEASGAFRLTLFEPPRTNTVPDWTLTTSDVFDIEAIEEASFGVINVIECQYDESNSVVASDTASIAAHGRRYDFFDAIRDPQVNSSGVATALVNAALGDLAQPLTNLPSVTTRLHHGVEVGDLIRVPANTFANNSAIDGAVTTVEWTFEPRQKPAKDAPPAFRTRLGLRGTASGGADRWRSKFYQSQRKGDLESGPISLPPGSDTIVPTVDARSSQTGSTGTLALTVNDPGGVVTAVAFYPVSGGADFDFTSDPSTWPQYDALAPFTLSDTVALVEGHPSFIAYAVGYDLGAGTVWLRGLVTFDADAIPFIACGMHVVGSSVWLSHLGDEDTGSIRYATSKVAMPTSGDVAAGTVVGTRSSDGTEIESALLEGETLYVRVRGFTDGAGGGTASAEDWRGRIERVELPTRVPSVRITTDQSGGTGTLTLEIQDPEGVVNATAFREASGGADYDFGTDPATWPVYDTTAPYTLTENVAIVGKHVSKIAWAVRYDLGEGGGNQWLQGEVPFDLDTIPDVSIGLHQVGSNVWLSWNGDEDLGSIRWALSTSAMPTGGDVATGTVQAGQSSDGVNIKSDLAEGETAYVRVRGFTDGVGGGTASAVDATGRVERPVDTVGIQPPVVQVGADAVGGTGSISLTIQDPDAIVNATSFETKSQAGDFDFTTDPTTWSGYDNVAPYDTTASVAMGDKHASKIAYAVGYDRGEGGGQEWIRGVVTFDVDEVPSVTCSLHRTEGGKVRLSFMGDDDTGSIRYAVSTSAMPSSGDVAAGTVSAGAAGNVEVYSGLTTDETLYVRVRAFTDGAGGGTASANDWQGQLGEAVPDDGVTSAKIVDGAVIAQKMTKSAQNVASDLQFFSTGYANISWGTGTLEFTDGTTQSILAGSQTMTLAAPTTYFVYYDGTNTLKVTTSYATAVGSDGNHIVCTAQRGSSTSEGEAFYVPLVGIMRGGIRVGTNQIVAGAITANEIRANTITTNELAADSVTAVEIDVVNLSSIKADVGTLTAGLIQNTVGTTFIDLDATGAGVFIKGGTDFTLTAAGDATFAGTIDGDNVTLTGSLTFLTTEGLVGANGQTLTNFPNTGQGAGWSVGTDLFRCGDLRAATDVYVGDDLYVFDRLIFDASGVATIVSSTGTTNIENTGGDCKICAAGGGDVTIGGSTSSIGFFGATPATKPTITGSRGGNAALANLLTDLAILGLITDSTT